MDVPWRLSWKESMLTTAGFAGYGRMLPCIDGDVDEGIRNLEAAAAAVVGAFQEGNSLSDRADRAMAEGRSGRDDILCWVQDYLLSGSDLLLAQCAVQTVCMRVWMLVISGDFDVATAGLACAATSAVLRHPTRAS
ncbi:hypothetical protein PRIPAC_76349, partial [Pristionchus pacificus]|uniref:Uncharacterized protein n=1 Tax=Pristionchus pacificus TaxID=54126 RepID=A0A2A6C8F7_PRIPA